MSSLRHLLKRTWSRLTECFRTSTYMGQTEEGYLVQIRTFKTFPRRLGSFTFQVTKDGRSLTWITPRSKTGSRLISLGIRPGSKGSELILNFRNTDMPPASSSECPTTRS